MILYMVTDCFIYQMILSRTIYIYNARNPLSVCVLFIHLLSCSFEAVCVHAELPVHVFVWQGFLYNKSTSHIR